MIRIILILSSFGLFIVCYQQELYADEIIKQNGEVLRGEIVQEDADKIRIHLGNGVHSIVRVKDIAKRRNDPLHISLILISKKELSRGRIASAVRVLERALDAAPENEEVQHSLAAALVRQAASELEKKHPAAAAHALRQSQQHKENDPQIEDFLNRLEIIIANLDQLEKKGLTEHTRGNWLSAYKYFKSLVKQDFSRTQKIRTPFAETLVHLGDKALVKKEHRLASRYYDDALELDPDLISWIEARWVSAHLEPIADLLSLKDFKSALEDLQNILKVVPDNINALYFRGVARARSKRLEEAANDFQKILKISGEDTIPVDFQNTDAFNKLYKKAKTKFETSFELLSLDEIQNRWAKVTENDWEVLSGNDWKVHHKNRWIAGQLQHAIGDAMRRISKTFSGNINRLPFEPTLDIYIYPTKEQYAEESDLPSWTGGVAQTSWVEKKAQSRRILSYQTSPQLIRSVIPHEIAHVMISQMIGPHDLPLWLDEGLAIMFEPDYKKKFYRNLVKERTAAGTRPTLKDFLKIKHYPEDEEEVKFFYAMSFSLTEKLVDKIGGQNILNWAKNVNIDNANDKIIDQLGALEALDESLLRP